MSDSANGAAPHLQDVYGTTQRQVGMQLQFLNDTMAKSGETLPRLGSKDAREDAPAIGVPAPVAPSRGGPKAGDEAAVPQAAAAAKPPKKMGTLLGVFLPCLQNILGCIYFVRLSWIVGQTGIQMALLVIGLCCCTTFLTSLSLSAIATNGAIKGGGPYYLISRALGPEFGGAVGLCFYLGTTVAGSMYILGAAETLLMSFPGLEICNDIDASRSGECALPIMNMRIYGYIILGICSLLVFAGVRILAKISPLFLLPVLVSVLFIWIGIFAASRDICMAEQEYPCLAATESGSGADPITNATFEGTSAANATDDYAGGTCDISPPLLALVKQITGMSGTNIGANYWPPEPLIEHCECDAACDFRFALALFFPSVTGIMAGSNRSGDLRDAQSSIPRGTIAATLVTSLLYLLTTFMYGAVASRDVLAAKNSVLLSAVVSWPHEYIVRVGIVLSTLGAGLQSMTGAPRLLQAIANDNLIPALRPFRGSGEPRLALGLCIVIIAGCIAPGSLNFVAPIITMFFLLCYMFVNLACLLQDLLGEPNWRPRFRFYHPLTSFAGLVLCLFIMFYTNPLFAAAAIIVVGLLYGYIQYRKVEAQWGDGMRGLRYARARNNLEQLEQLDQTQHTKNWRPQVIALCKLGPPGQSLNQPKLLGLLAQLKGGRGLCILGSVLPGRLVKDAKTQKVAEKSLRRQRDENKVRGFTQVIMCPDVDAGLTSLIQTAGLGGLAPNTLLLGWSRNWDKDPARAPRMCKLLLEAQAYKMAVVAVKGVEHVPDSAGRMFRPMDLWWVMHDGGLQLLLSTVLRKSRVWQSTALRVFCVVHGDEEDPTALQKKMAEFLYKMRIDAEVKVVVLAEGADAPGVRDHIVGGGRNRADWLEKATRGSTTAGNNLSTLRGGTAVAEDRVDEPRNAGNTPPVVARSNSKDGSLIDESGRSRTDTGARSRTSSGEREGVLRPETSGRLSQASGAPPEEVAMVATKMLNRVITKYSEGSSLVMTNLPMPTIESGQTPAAYMRIIDALTEDIPLCILVAGQKDANVVTMYS